MSDSVTNSGSFSSEASLDFAGPQSQPARFDAKIGNPPSGHTAAAPAHLGSQRSFGPFALNIGEVILSDEELQKILAVAWSSLDPSTEGGFLAALAELLGIELVDKLAQFPVTDLETGGPKGFLSALTDKHAAGLSPLWGQIDLDMDGIAADMGVFLAVLGLDVPVPAVSTATTTSPDDPVADETFRLSEEAVAIGMTAGAGLVTAGVAGLLPWEDDEYFEGFSEEDPMEVKPGKGRRKVTRKRRRMTSSPVKPQAPKGSKS